MKLRPQSSPDRFSSGFTSENDIFQQADLAKRLTSLLKSLTQGSVSVLDGRWGTGKTTFAKMWIADLEQAGIPAIYFDAFAHDFIDDPFQAVSSAFIKAAIDRRKTTDPIYKKYLSRTAAVARRLAAVTAKAGVKLATLGALSATDLESLSEISDDLADSAGEVGEEAVKAMLEKQAAAETTFSQLRESLNELPQLFAPDDPPNDNARLVVVIDELDRCRPDFALGVVETLKHFFRMERLHFVLVTNMRHLELSVSHRYGVADAAAEYLQKFYDFVVHHEPRYGRHDVGTAQRYTDYLFRDLVPEHASAEDKRHLPEYIRSIAQAFRLTLRQIEGIVGNVMIALLAANEREFRPHILVSFLCAMKFIRPDMYIKVKHGRFDLEEFSGWLSSANWDGTFNFEHVIQIFKYYSDPTISRDDPEYAGWGRELWNYNLDRIDVLPYLANSIIDRFGRVD